MRSDHISGDGRSNDSDKKTRNSKKKIASPIKKPSKKFFLWVAHFVAIVVEENIEVNTFTV